MGQINLPHTFDGDDANNDDGHIRGEDNIFDTPAH